MRFNIDTRRISGRLAISLLIYLLLVSGARSLEATELKHATLRPQSKRPVAVADAIRMTKLGDHQYFSGGSSEGRVAQFSPDGKQFVVVLRKGNLEQNTNEFSLLLWRTDEVFQSPKPKTILTLSSSSNREAIADITWLDNQTLAFLGEHPGEVRQVYTLNTRTRHLTRITNHVANVLGYRFVGQRQHRIVFTAEEQIGTIFDQKAPHQGFVVPLSQTLSHLIRGIRGGWFFGNDQIFVQQTTNGSQAIKVPLNPSERVSAYCETPFPSPDGKYVLIPTQVAAIPESWKSYADATLGEFLKTKLGPGLYSPLSRYVLIDMNNGTSHVFLNSPIGLTGCNAIWSSDSKSVVLSNVYLPLVNTQQTQRNDRESKTFAAEINVATGKIDEISSDELKLVGWDNGTKRLIFESRQSGSKPGQASKIFFEKRRDEWIKLTNAEQNDRPELALEEDMNSPPRIFVTDENKGRRAMLLDLNPQFNELKFAKVEEVKWKCTDGHEVKGGLYYPLNYDTGKRYPLVIQTHQWNSTRFWIDGPWTTAFAAQPLAGREIMVLQVDESYQDLNTPKEVDREVASIEAAVDYLDEKGTIDRNRVGVIGFSRTCLFVKYVLTHSRYKFAAASTTDGVDGGYFQWIQEVNADAIWGPYQEGLYDGALPYGQGLRKWMDRSPGFNLDRVDTPLLVTALNPSSALFEWEWFAGLSRLGKPVQMVVLEDGDHILQKPSDRMISQEGNVDWFCFWLKGEEDPDPIKTEQYARWRELRKLQEENDKKAAEEKSKPMPQ
jgi:dipeptidyl aminopeptidase/acylaminoacyl peptidase